MAGVRQELAAGGVQGTPKTEVEATSIPPSLNGKTAPSWRGIVPFTHLPREGRMTVTIGRRELLVARGGAAAAWSLAARAQQGERVRRVGMLMGYPENDLEGQAHIEAFREQLQKLGWTEGRNIHINSRWVTS